MGHIMVNVVPACIRCNYARGTMPFTAWVLLTDGLKKAREEGLFGTWMGRWNSSMSKSRKQVSSDIQIP